MSGFADIRRERSARPAPGIPPHTQGDDLPAQVTGADSLSDSPYGRFLAGLSPAARAVTLRNLARVHRDPRKVSQDELDNYDDETKWNWLENVCRAEAADAEQAAALAAQQRWPADAGDATDLRHDGGTP